MIAVATRGVCWWQWQALSKQRRRWRHHSPALAVKAGRERGASVLEKRRMEEEAAAAADEAAAAKRQKKSRKGSVNHG